VSAFTLRRRAARVVLLDSVGKVLLLQASDPAARSKPPWWEIPGGGMDPHESSEECAVRELYEEVGITDARVGPCVWVQDARFTFAGLRFDQHERVHVAWLDRPGHDDDYRPAGLEALEAMAFVGHRWWGVDDLLAGTERVLPYRLREFLPHLVAGELPPEPLDITHPTPPW
jgi:8-oxo-dGTP pyrophosphatase MutT (NUDIX family)